MGFVIRRGEQARQRAIKIVKNGGTFQDAASATGFCINYVRQLCKKDGVNAQFRNADRKKDKIVDLINLGYSAKEIADELGYKSPTSVYTFCRERGIKIQARKTRDNKIVELRKAGYSMAQCSEICGVNASTIWGICKKYGVAGVKSDIKQTVYRNQYTKRTEEEKRKYVESLLPSSFSYVSGYKDCDSKVTIRCNVCGNELIKSMVGIRHRQKPICPNCTEQKKKQKEIEAEIEAERAKADKEEQRKQKTEMRKAKKLTAQILNTLQVQCVECGRVFATTDSKRVCCSAKCSKHKANRRHDRRIAQDKRIDRDISVARLFERDKGICWICGMPCDLKDYKITKKAKVCGDNYPSIDHVIPVCAGGLDSWENVRLAHRKCNLMRFVQKKHTPPVGISTP